MSERNQLVKSQILDDEHLWRNPLDFGDELEEDLFLFSGKLSPLFSSSHSKLDDFRRMKILDSF